MIYNQNAIINYNQYLNDGKNTINKTFWVVFVDGRKSKNSVITYSNKGCPSCGQRKREFKCICVNAWEDYYYDLITFAETRKIIIFVVVAYLLCVAIGSVQFQLVTICHRFIFLFF